MARAERPVRAQRRAVAARARRRAVSRGEELPDGFSFEDFIAAIDAAQRGQ
jgi:hypothetical protein